jgi:hypothetical protein
MKQIRKRYNLLYKRQELKSKDFKPQEKKKIKNLERKKERMN